MIKCPHCLKDFVPTRRKRSSEERKSYRTSSAWTKSDKILLDYNKGDTIIWLVKKYRADKRTIRNILIEKGITSFRGRKGIQAWNKGKEVPSIQGSKSPHWKGGITPLNIKVRRCAKYQQWVKDIFTRDNWTCQICKQRGGGMEADHFPVRFSEVMKDYEIDTFEKAKNCTVLWNLSNGRTLCIKCHNKTKSFKNSKL